MTKYNPLYHEPRGKSGKVLRQLTFFNGIICIYYVYFTTLITLLGAVFIKLVIKYNISVFCVLMPSPVDNTIIHKSHLGYDG